MQLFSVSEDVPYFDRSMADVYPKLGRGFKFLGYSILHHHSFDKTINLKVQLEELYSILLNSKTYNENHNASSAMNIDSDLLVYYLFIVI